MTTTRLPLLAYLASLHIIAILLFSNGFLLTRISLDNVNESEVELASITFGKAIVLVIDALRYDFTTPRNESSPYWNHLTILSEISKSSPSNAFLTKFVADPPTTTLQRLKGLTTGSLPTFIDAGSNFAGEAITEDNLISALRNAKKRIAFVGDDTWQALFPDTFEKELNYPFESLNVWDLDTVDNGVYDHLFNAHDAFLSEQSKSRWDVVIAHALGLDHSGHRYGPNHPETTRKLLQMNDWIRQIVDRIDNDTLLVVLGDHGMNPQGDHGGDSIEELEAALFMYAKKDIFTTEMPRNGDTGVPQIDLVPTFALLMGLPVPFNNLGSPIPDVFMNNPRLDYKSAVDLTSTQIESYIETYSTHSTSIKQSLGAIRTADSQDTNDAIRWQRDVLEVFRQQWAQYDLISITHGIVLMLATVILSVRLFCSTEDRAISFFLSAFISMYSSYALYNLRASLPLRSILCGFAMANGSFYLSWVFDVFGAARSKMSVQWTSYEFIGTMLVFLHALIFASNSFTIHEDRITLYIITTLGTLLVLQALKENRYRQACYSCAIVILSRLVASIRACREEQVGSCISTFYDQSAWTIYSVYTIAAIITIFSSRAFLRRFALDRKSRQWISWVFVIPVIFIGMYWALEKFTPTATQFHRIAARTFIISMVSLSVAWYRLPLPISFLMNEQRVLQVVGLDHVETMMNLQFTLPLISLLIFLGRGIGSLSLLILVLQLFLLTQIHIDRGQMTVVRCALLVELGFLHFFTTGHQMALPFIQWDMAFLVSKRIIYPVSPLLVACNAFGAFIIIALWSPVSAAWRPRAQENDKTDGPVNKIQQELQITRTMIGVLTGLSLLLLSTMCFATHFRRHLMVWKIFAPRFMCAALILLIVDAIMLISSLGQDLGKRKLKGLAATLMGMQPV